jgi:preprotein translocase subunit SecE
MSGPETIALTIFVVMTVAFFSWVVYLAISE